MRQMTSARFQEYSFDDPSCAVLHYHSVEFFVDGLQQLYQSRVWSRESDPMFTLVKEDSDVLNRIHVGDILSMKFYSEDRFCPPRDLSTEIKYITRDEQGRFKGHYKVGLAIISN